MLKLAFAVWTSNSWKMVIRWGRITKKKKHKSCNYLAREKENNWRKKIFVKYIL